MTPLLQQFTGQLVPPVGELPHKEFSATRTYDTAAAARAAYEQVRTRLLHPETWQELAGNFSAAFRRYNRQGLAVSGPSEVDQYLKISIPSPMDVYADWVRIEALETATAAEEDLVGMRVRPTEDLQKEGHETAHFFGAEATSTWVLHRAGKKLTAYYFGRGETPNEEGASFWKQVRDKIVALAGVAGFSDLQWEALLEGLLDGKPETA